MLLKHYACKRAYLKNKKLLDFLKKNAEFIGEAKFTDYVFGSKDTDKELLWVRYIQKNSWPSMKVGKFYPFHKSKIKWPSDFQVFEMPVGSSLKHCSSLDKAKTYLPKNLRVLFSFSRKTLEYKIGNLLIYVEDVQHIPLTVEVVCKTEKNSLKKNKQLVNDFLKQHNLLDAIPHQVATLVKKQIKH